jgi:amino acid transporter
VTHDETASLSKGIRLSQLFTFAFGYLVGFGWIVMTGYWIATAGAGGSALAFLLGGLCLIPIGLCYVELATAFPYPGGEFVYTYQAFGKGVAFIAGWILLFLFVSLTAFETVAAAWIITILFPAVSGTALYQVFGFQMTSGMLLLMILGVAAITSINYRGSQAMAKAQELVTYVLVALTLIIILAGITLGDVRNMTPAFRGSTAESKLAGIIGVFITTAIWYSGINALPQALSEMTSKPSARALSKLVTFMLLGSIIFYVLIILAVGMSAPRQEISGADFSTALAMEKLLGSELAGKLVLVAGLLGIVTTWNAAHFAASRVLYSLGRSHLTSERFSKVHPRFGSPSVAVIFVGLAGLLGAMGGTPMIGAIVSTGVIAVSLLFVLSCSSLLRLRAVQPSASRDYRVPAYPWLPLFSLGYAVCTVIFAFVVTWNGRIAGHLPIEWLVLLVWTVLGLFISFGARNQRKRLSEPERARIIAS